MALGLIYDLSELNHKQIIKGIEDYFSIENVENYIKKYENYNIIKQKSRNTEAFLKSPFKNTISDDELRRLQDELTEQKKLIKEFDDSESIYEDLNFSKDYSYKSDIKAIFDIVNAILYNDASRIYSLIDICRWRFSTIIRALSHLIPTKFILLSESSFNYVNVSIVKDGRWILEDSIELGLSFSLDLEKMINSVK